MRRRRRRRPEQRLRRRPDRREGRGRPRRHGRDPVRHRSPTPARATPIGGRDGHREQRRPRRSTPSPTPTGDYSLFLAAGSYVVTGDRVRLRPDDRVRRHDRRPTRRPTRTSPSTALPRFTVSPATSAPPRTARRSRTPPSARSARPSRRRRPNAAGAYSLELPIGDYTLHASAGGCTEQGEADDQPRRPRHHPGLLAVPQARRLRPRLPPDPVRLGRRRQTRRRCTATSSRAGCTCRSTSSSTARPTRQIWLSDNGYVNFLGPDQFNFFPSAIPSPATPNAAIYPFWQDLAIDAQSSIDYATVGIAPEPGVRHRVLLDAGLRVADPRLASRSSSGRTAGSTCSTATTRRTRVTAATRRSASRTPTARDALQFGFLERRPRPEQRLPLRARPERPRPRHRDRRQRRRCRSRRRRSPPRPAAGGPRPTPTATTTLRLRPGAYTLTASAINYVDAIASGDRRRRRRHDRSTSASTRRSARVDPTEVSATVDFGDTTDADVTLSNTGTGAARLGGEGARPAARRCRRCRRRPRSSSARRLGSPADPGRRSRGPSSRTRRRAGRHRPRARSSPTRPAIRSTRTTSRTVRAGSDGSTVASMAIDFAPATPMRPGRRLRLPRHRPGPDDRRPGRGALRQADPGHRHGVLRRPVLANSDGDRRPSSSADTVRDRRGASTATSTDHTISFDIPLEALGGDDGFINTAMVVGLTGAVRLGARRGPRHDRAVQRRPVAERDAGFRHDRARAATRSSRHTWAARPCRPASTTRSSCSSRTPPSRRRSRSTSTLTVTLPPEFGAITGTVTDAHTGEPLGGVGRRRPRDVEGRAARPRRRRPPTTARTRSSARPARGRRTTRSTAMSPITPGRHDRQGVTTSGADAALHNDPAARPARRRPAHVRAHAGPDRAA